MISIKDRKILGQIFSHYDYVMTTAQLSKEKLYYRDVQRMLEAGLIERIKRGYYHWAAGSGKGDVVIISRLFPDGILCMETALFYYGYSDRNPAEWNIAIDKNASRQRTRIDYPSIKAYRLEPALLSIGVTRGEINFTDVRIYDRDRTICDVLRNMNKMDKEIFNKAIQGYCRVSTDNEDQANSFESQQRYFRQYIERNPDWELYEIFADEGISGTNTKKRKEFNRMIACAKNGDFDLIITKEISRFARNTLDSIYYTRELKKHGVGVIFMNDNINTLDGDAELRLAIMSSIAQEESRKTSERVKWGQKRQMEQGVVFGRSMLGYDVDGGKMTINEEGAKVVRLIFHKFVNEGKGTHVIARELREEGISPMRVKEWSNTVILRVIRNEKYCGDLVQKKTYTPDFLSHEKKYNRGQEEFVIIKDHHEPIISRELFDEANRILDAKSLSQEGKAKHSNRYPFSGKIKCGCCGSSYVARYKTRKDGSRYKAWRCNEAAKHGSPHIDKAGNQVGCTGLSIRNEDATHIMYLVTKSLKYNRNKIINNLTAVIQSIIAMDTTGTDVLKLQEQIKKIEGKRANLIDLYMSNLINKDEFTATRASCDAEIEELQSIIESVDKQREMIEQQQQLLKEIEDAIKEIVSGVEYEDEFYKHILDKMVVQDKDNIDVYLNLLPMKWSYTVAKASKKAVASEWNISEASLPMSVSRAFSSG